MADGPLSLEQMELEEALGLRDPPYPIAGPPPPAAPAELSTEQILAGELPPELAPPPAGEEDPLAGAGMHRAFAGRPVAVPTGPIAVTRGGGITEVLQPGQAGYQEALQQQAGQEFAAQPPVRMGSTTVQTGLQSDTDARARSVGGQALALVEQLRREGMPEETIRQRLGIRTGPAPARGVGGMARPAAPKLPPELQALNPEPGYYLPGYRETLEGADIPEEQKGQLRQQYDRWLETDPRGVEFREQEMGLGFAEKMSGFEQQKQAAEQKQLDAQRELYAQQQEKAQLQEAEFRQFRQDFERDYQQISAEHRSSIDEMKATKVDPRRGGIPIIDALASALGAAGAAFTGQPNFAQQIIQSRIDNDIKAQLADLGTLKDVAAAQQNRLGMLRQRLGDEQAAINMERQLQLDSARAFLAEKKATAGSELARIDADRYTAEVDRQLSRAQIGYEKGIRVQAAIRADERMQQRRAAMAAANRKQREAAEMQRSGMGPWQTQGISEVHKKYVPGLGIVPSEKQAISLNEKLQDFDTISAEINELSAIGQRSGSSFSPKDRARAQALTSHLFGLIKKPAVLDLGVIAGKDLEMIEGMVANPTKVGAIGVQDRLRQTDSIIQAQRARLLRGVQATPAEMATIADPKTGAPTAAYRLAMPGRQAPGAQQQITEMPVAP